MEKGSKKAWYKKWWVWLIIIVIIGGIASASGNNNSDTPASTTNDNNSAQNDTSEEKTEFKIGETASFDSKSITVKEVQRNYDTGNQFSRPESGKEFVLITVEIANNSSSSMDYNTFEFKLQDSNGVQQSESFTAISDGKLNSGSLAPSGKVTGKLAYEAPQDDSGLKLLYQSYSFFSNKVITFNLQ